MSNTFWEQQQQFYKLWNNGMGKLPGMDTYMGLFQNMAPGVPNYWENMTKMMPGTSDYLENFTKLFPGAESFSGMWPYKIPGMGTYTKVFDLWKGLGDPASFLQSFQGKYADLMQDIFQNFLPAGSAPFFEKPKELLDTCVAFYQHVCGPWMKIDESILQRIAQGDTHAYRDFFKAFGQRYEETFDKIYNMASMGLNREANEDQMKANSAYMKSLFVAGELVSLVMETFTGSMKQLLQKYQDTVKEGKTVTTFREFYDLWYGVTEESMLGLFNTDEYSKVFGDFSDKYGKYLIAMNRVYERMLAPLPIPTNTDMKSLYQTVHDLRKEVRDLHRELDAWKASAKK